MKILFLTTVSLSINGVTEFISQYVKNEKDNYIDIVASMPSDKEMKDELRKHCNNLYELEHRKDSTFKYLVDLVKLIKKNKYDIVHAHGSSATLAIELLAAKLAGCPVRIGHSHNTQCENVKLDKILRPLFYATSTHALACGQKAGEWLFPNREFHVIPNGRSVERFKFNSDNRRKIRGELGIEDSIVIGHVGVFYPQKNHKFIIDLFTDLLKESANYKLVLIGSGPQFDEIKEYSKEKGVFENIVFTGLIGNVDEYLSAMDIMILPSLFEGLPLVAVEWQINGLPTLLADTITDECKISDLAKFLPISDTKYWVEEILKFEKRAKSDEHYQEFAKLVYEQGYDVKHTSEKLNDYYAKIMEKKI